MDNQQDETTTFEVTVTSDGVSTSGISGSPQIVLDTNNTLSWGINECSSSFQSVSSCETLESYEHNALNASESPQVIVVPFLADNEITGNVLADNGVHIPVIKECSIRIDQLKMSSSAHCDEVNVERIIELPFSTNCSTDCSSKTQPGFLTDDDSSAFEGFGLESIIGTQYEMYKAAVSLMNKKQAENITGPPANEPILTERILTERHLTERHHPVRHPPERIIKADTVKRPRQIQRKISKPQMSDNQSEPINQSRIANPENDLPTSKQNNIVKPVPIADQISSTPAENVDVKSNRPESSSDSSDSDSDVAPAAVHSSATKNKVDRSADIKNKNKQKELRKLEKMRRRKELSLVAERIRDHWRETFAAAKRKQRKKAKKSKMESNKYKTHHSKNDSPQYRPHRKRKRISCSSDSDSSDSSDTSCSSSSDSDSDSNDSDSTRASDTSYTSQTSHTRTESSTDSDSSDVHCRYRHRLNRCKRSPSATSDTSETSSSEDTFDKRRKLLKKAIYRKQSKAKSHDNCPKPRKRKSSESYRCDEPLQKKKKVTKNSDRAHSNDDKQTKNRTIFSQKQQRFDVPSRSSSARVKKIKSEFAKRSEIETTSAGNFSVRQCCFD